MTAHVTMYNAFSVNSEQVIRFIVKQIWYWENTL